jgi:L-lactate utilization protein LutC
MPPLEPQDYQSKFEAEWQKVGGIAHCVASMDELEAVFRKVLVETGAVTLSRNPLLAQLRIAERLAAMGKLVTSWDAGSGGTGTVSLPDFNKASFAAGAGITGVDYVLAESGSLVLNSATEGAQVASLAPPMHIALYRRSQLVGSLDEVLAKLPISNPPPLPAQAGHPTSGRSVVIVTGTSRTADIEQILIRGVHGPREAHAILVEDSCR